MNEENIDLTMNSKCVQYTPIHGHTTTLGIYMYISARYYLSTLAALIYLRVLFYVLRREEDDRAIV